MKRFLAAVFTLVIVGGSAWLVTHRPKWSPAHSPVSFSNRVNVEVRPQSR